MTRTELFWSHVSSGAHPRGCREWLAGRFATGYGAFCVNGANRGAHRHAWELTHGPIPPGRVIMHKCDNPPCCNPEHLALGTPKDNSQDMSRKGRTGVSLGERHGNSRLTSEQVLDMRALRTLGWSYKAIGGKYDIKDLGYIGHIIRRDIWRHI